MRYILPGLICMVFLLAGCQMPPPTGTTAPAQAAGATEEMTSTAEMTSTVMMSDDEKIANAMTAGPTAITTAAAVLDWPSAPDAQPVELRAGTNGWVCRPDDPVSIANDPRCFDANWLKVNGKAFGPDREAFSELGLAYMLQGGSVVDNNDPSVLQPAAGQEWQIDPPHIMVNSPIQWDPELYSTDHHSGGPWIMFSGTPVEHLMVPTWAVEVRETDNKIDNALSAGPASIAENAAVMDWPAEAGGELVELRPGTNGWTCLPDDPTTPTNDPVCNDEVFLDWFKAVVAGTEPQVSRVGFAYMLQGGSVADNDDPSVMEPAAGQEWQIDPPHIMIVSPNKLDMALNTNDHHSGGPWVMFGGTPFEHIMFPVTEPVANH